MSTRTAPSISAISALPTFPALLGLVLTLAASACPGDEDTDAVEIYALTAAPPARTATITNTEERHRVELSSGVAIAFSCWESCEYECVAPEFVIGDPSLVEIRPIFRLRGGSTAWVMIGKSPGSTQLVVRTTCTNQAYSVQIREE
jgi:hypothetical protein